MVLESFILSTDFVDSHGANADGIRPHGGCLGTCDAIQTSALNQIKSKVSLYSALLFSALPSLQAYVHDTQASKKVRETRYMHSISHRQCMHNLHKSTQMRHIVSVCLCHHMWKAHFYPKHGKRISLLKSTKCHQNDLLATEEKFIPPNAIIIHQIWGGEAR